MSKGDHVTVTTTTGQTVTVEAMRAGRRVRQEEHSRNKTRWLDIMEVTRGGRETGNTASIRYDQVVSVAVTTRDTAEAEAQSRNRKKRGPVVLPGQTDMMSLLEPPVIPVDEV